MDKRKETLLSALQDKDAEIRKTAAAAIEKLETRDRLDFIAKKIETGEMLDKVRAVYALADLKGAKILEVLVKASKDPSEDVRAATVRMLGNIGDPNAVAPLVEMLKDASTIVQRVVIESLSRYRDSRLLGPLTQMLRSSDPGVVERALDVAGRYGDKRVEEAMMHFAAKGNPKMRSISIKALGEMDR